jgi:hypothetical protein
MRSATTYFNVHGLVRFQITTHGPVSGRLSQRLTQEYEYFASEPLDDLDFAVEIGPFEPANDDCYVLEDGQYFIREGYFYCEDSYKLAKWMVEISNIESGVTQVRIAPNLFGYLFVGGYIIDFLIRFKANEKGIPFVHGSALSKDGVAVLFPARSGSGKTVLAMSLLEQGYDLLGDNFVMLDRGKVLSYPSRMNIFFYNLTPSVRKSLDPLTLFVLQLKYWLYRFTFGYAKIFTPVSVQKVFPDRSVDEAELKKVFLLIPEDGNPQIEPLGRKDMVRSLVLNNKLDAFPFFDYILEYAFVFPDSNLANHWINLERNYSSILEAEENCYYKVSLPSKLNAAMTDEIRSVLGSVSGGQ